MFFKKKEEMTVIEYSENKSELVTGLNVDKQLEMIHLRRYDLFLIKKLQPLIEKHIDEIVKNFYKNLSKESSLLSIVNNNSSIQRLSGTLRNHIIEMFDGVLDEQYFIKRTRIAKMHVKIGLEPKWYMCAFQDLLASLLELFNDEKFSKQEVLEYNTLWR